MQHVDVTSPAANRAESDAEFFAWLKQTFSNTVSRARHSKRQRRELTASAERFSFLYATRPDKMYSPAVVAQP